MNKSTLLILILAGALLASCGPVAKLRRAERLIAEAEAKGAKWHSDTVYKEIPLIIPQVRTDTVLRVSQGDTVFVAKDRLKIKFVRLPGDSVFIEGKCESDTVKIEVPVSVTKTISAGYSLWQLILAGLFGVVLGGFLAKLFWR